MPKLTRYPGLRSHVRKSKRTGRVKVYYYLDHRVFHTERDIPCGTVYEEAVKVWEEYKLHKPRIQGTLEEAFKAWEEQVLPTYTNKGTAKNYRLSLKRLRPVFGVATWDAIRLKHLVDYLAKRKAKRQANHEMALLSIVWNWARKMGYTDFPWPAAGMAKVRWKNKEQPRRYRVTDEVFEAIYAKAEPMLMDCMDLASATAFRLTDCRTVALPRDNIIHCDTSKTGHEHAFDVNLSQVLPGLLERRRALKAPHLMLLSMPDGKKVTPDKLRGAYDRARAAAAKAADEAQQPELAKAIRAMWLRDCRKYAAGKTGSIAAARELLGHADEKTTRDHYFLEPVHQKPAR